MDSTPVNWEALDSLVIDFARSENLIEDPTPSPPAPPAMPPPPPPSTPSSSSSSSYQCRILIRQIRRSVESGDVDSAIELLLTHAPQVLKDHRLLFRLQKQKFIELLRIGTDEAREAAIKCLRGAVAPVALDAYPEAYEEFKHILLALIFNKDDKSSPVANEWSEARRLEIAGLLSSVLTAHLHAYDPIFAMTLRYLISIHKVFCFRQGIPSPISDLTQRLLFEDRDPPATPSESLYEAPPFDEVDIQALAHAVELTRQGAVDSLRFARGNLFEAFQNELCRMKMDVAILDDLIHEYCVYRGIVENTHMVSSVSGTTRLREGEFHVHDDIKGDHAVEIVSNHINGSEQRFSHDIASNLEDCSTSETNQSENNCRRFRKGRIHGAVHCNRRKRWRGRTIGVTRDVASQCGNRKEGAHLDRSIVDEEQNSDISSAKEIYDLKYEVILEMRELASKGMTTEVVEEITVIDPGFFTQYPTLLFQLKQVEFLKLVSDGDYTRALKVASSYLGPLATSNPDLLKPLKETLFALLRPNEDALNRGTPLSILATSLQVALGGKLDVEEPKLMKIMRATLHTHSEWFRLQMCNDRFEGLLNIDSLKEIGIPKFSDVGSKVLTDHCARGPVPVLISCSGTVPDGINTPSELAGDVVCDEHAILKVMEFLALPRADAIHLLAQYNGNAEAVIQQIFA